MSEGQPITVSQAIALALDHHRAGRIGEAENIYRQVLVADPTNFDALHLLGAAALQSGRANEAADRMSAALAINPNSPYTYNNLGEARRALGDLDGARDAFDRAIALKPDCFEAHNNLGNIYQTQERIDEAEKCYRAALAVKPGYPEARVNLGNILQDRGNWEAAIEQYELAIELRPGYAMALNNLGNTLRAERKLEEALPYFEQAVAADPKHTQARVNLGHVLLSLGSRTEAIASFEAALAIDPDNADARWALTFSQLALVHADDEPQEDFREAFSTALTALDTWIGSDRLAPASSAVGTLQPFYLAYHEENNQDLLRQYGNICCRVMNDWQQARNIQPRHARRSDGRVHLAIASAQIYGQSVWNAIVKGWCTQLDPARVAISIFHLGAKDDAQTSIARSRAQHFSQGARSMQAWAAQIQSQMPDAIVYPEIGMDPMSLRLASLRLAPVQLASWGHPETTGLPTIDYYLSAEAFEPGDAEAYYTEQLVRLPNLGTYYDALDVEPLELDFEALGIDLSVPRLVCPGAPFKYLPQHDHVFVEIARKVGACQFLFFQYARGDLHRQLADRLETVFKGAGLAFEQLVRFVPWLKRPLFHALLRKSDVYLDTIGFSGFNTAIQAIECGLPVVTLEGRFMRGRFGSAILRRLGVDALVAASKAEFVDAAVRVAREPVYRHEARTLIERSRWRLFADVEPIRALEDMLARAIR
jgi:predicted O-linked N-acetylglucosamine transferase (SPINDLY family)